MGKAAAIVDNEKNPAGEWGAAAWRRTSAVRIVEAADRMTAYKVCRTHGCTRDQIEMVAQLQGLSLRQVAAARGVTHKAIARARDRAYANIKRRYRR